MAYQKIDVEKIAHLARISLNEEEKNRFQQQLEKVVAYIKKLEQLDVSGIEPTAHAHHVTNVMRPDEIQESFTADQTLHNAPQKTENQFLINKVID